MKLKLGDSSRMAKRFLRNEPVGVSVDIHTGSALRERVDSWIAQGRIGIHPQRDLRWLKILQDGLGQQAFLLEAREGDDVLGVLPLAYLNSWCFGKFLVSLPYVNSGGVDDVMTPKAAHELVDAAVDLADALNCRFLELRHESEFCHPALNAQMRSKVHMRLQLPNSSELLRTSLSAKVRNQIRKGERHAFTVHWGGIELLPEFYSVFCLRMHQLGTPVYSSRLFASILKEFREAAEICCLRYQGNLAASAILIHGQTITEVPSASANIEYNPMNANMLMYWHLLLRALERGNHIFDFGRTTVGSHTHQFKKQWGAVEHPTCWQYYVRRGSADFLRPDNVRNQGIIRLWRRLPLWLTRHLGPCIVRGIP